MKKIFSIVLLALLSVTFACKKTATSSSDEQAIKQTLETYLTTKKNINLKSMTVDYKNFQITPDHATVDVMFKSGPSNDMSIGFKYSLKKTAGGWEVEKGEATSGSMFGGHTPEAAPMASGTEGQLPPGHPMVAPPAGGTPSGGMEPAHGKDETKKK